jgi:hypothetical protein
MSTRVLATDEAKAAIAKMQGIIGQGLADQVRQLDAEGRRLSDPNVWDGPSASHFRNEVWPETKKTLDRSVTALDELRGKLQRVHQEIMRAGGTA